MINNPTGVTTMIETHEKWLEDLFEFEYCGECGGDAEDHEVCIVPGIGNYFARCLRVDDDETDADAHNTVDRELRRRTE